MDSFNNVNPDAEKEAPSAISAAVTEQPGALPEPDGSSASLSEGNTNIQQETAEVTNTEGVRTKPDIPWKWTDHRDLENEFAQTFSQQEREDALKKTIQVVKQYSDDMIKRWNEEIDNFLVYAGLFSSILTAFNVQSYLLLQPSTPDPTLLILQQISHQLNSFSVTPPGALVNSTYPSTFTPVQASPVEAWAVWLNSLWFSSLILSLTSASIGIMVKQWTHEYRAGISGDSLEIARIRQYRLNHLEKWHVAEIIAFLLPVLLQIALFLFFCGLLILLWHYNSTVAIVVSVLITIVTLFVVGTMIMPIVWRSCCYLSPPVYLLFNLAQHAKVASYWLLISILRATCSLYGRLLGDSAEMLSVSYIISDYGSKLNRFTWRSYEQVAVQSHSSTIDLDMTVFAYSTTIDINHLSGACAILASHGAPLIDRYYTIIQHINLQHFGEKHMKVTSPDSQASQLFYSIDHWVDVEILNELRYSFRSRQSPEAYHRLLLALAATVSRSTQAEHSKVQSLSIFLLEELFTFDPDALRLMPWNAVCRVAAAMEAQMHLPLDLPYFRDEHSQGSYRILKFLALRILVQCCFAPVPSWPRSPEEERACMQYILGLDFLQKELLREESSKMPSDATQRSAPSPMLRTLSLILTYLGDLIPTYLGESADELRCRSAAEGFMEAVQTVIEKLKDSDSSEFKQLKANFQKCESFGLLPKHL